MGKRPEKSSVQLSVTPMDSSPPGSSVHGILQERILDWVAISSCRGSYRPRDWSQVFCIAGRIFTDWATRGSQRKSSTKWKDINNLLNGRKYLQIAYLIRGQFLKHRKNTYIHTTHTTQQKKRKKTTQLNSGQKIWTDIFLKKKKRDGQYAHMTHHQGNVNQNHNEILPLIC